MLYEVITYEKVVSSGPTIPNLPPASIVMLQTVNRSSIDMRRTASPAYSIAYPVPPPRNNFV